MKLKLSKALLTLVGVVAFLKPASLIAGVNISLSGSSGNSSIFLQTQKTVSGSISVSFDIGSYVQLGLTHQQATSNETGYTYDASQKAYVYSETLTSTQANSLDLTLILYAGEIFTPYVKAGAVIKKYTIMYDQNEDTKTTFPAPLGAQAGLGLSIKLNQKFSLNLSTTHSVGYRQETPNDSLKQVIDVSNSVGITFKI